MIVLRVGMEVISSERSPDMFHLSVLPYSLGQYIRLCTGIFIITIDVTETIDNSRITEWPQ